MKAPNQSFARLTRACVTILTATGLMLLASPDLRAANGTWSSAGNATLGGTGNWTGGSTWWDGASAFSWTNGDNATFSAAGNTTVNSDVTAGTLTFSSGASNISILNGTGNLTINSGITATNTANSSARTFTISESNLIFGGNQIWTVNNGGTVGTTNLAVSSALSGAFGLTKEGNGTLTLSGAKSYTGNTTVNAGTLSVTAGALSRNIIVNSGAKLITANHNMFTSGANLTVNGGTLDLSVFAQGGGLSVANLSNATVTGAGGYLRGVGTYNFSGNNSWGNASLDISFGPTTLNVNDGTTTMAFGFSTTVAQGAVTKSGNGTLVLNAANTYTNLTTLNAGTLALNNNTALGTSTFTIAGGTIDNTSGSLKTLSNNNTQNWNSDFTFAGTNDLNMGTGNVTMNASRTVTANAGNFTVGGNITGAGFGLTKNGSGTMILSGTNTYTGATRINAGTLSIGSITNGGVAGALGNSSNAAANLVLGGGTLLYTGASAATDRNYTLSAGTSSTISVSNATSTLTLSGGSAATNGSLIKTGSGSLILSGNNSHSGSTTINGGTLFLNGSAASSAITVNSGGTLAGSGTGGSTTVNSGGRIAPGNSPGILTVGDLTLNSGGGYTWEMANATGAAGTGWDQIMATGALTVGATSGSPFTIYLTSTGQPSNWDFASNGQTWDIIDYGTFNGTFDASKFSIDASAFQGATTLDSSWSLSDTGSALRLTYNYVPSVPTYTTGSGNWSAGMNPAPTSGGALVFVGAGGTATNDITSGSLSSISTLLFTGSGAYTLQANSGSAGYDAASALAVGGTITNNSSVTQTINLATSYAANQTINANTGNITVGGAVAIASGQTLTVAGSNSTAVGGQITGAGSLTKNDSGALTLSGANTYGGSTTLNAGTLNINNATALGNGTFTINGGTLNNTSGSAITLANNNAQNWNTDIAFTGTNSLNLGTGAVSMNASRAVTVNGGTLTVGGVISGSGFGLTKNGSGTLTLNGNNTYNGSTTINAGTLEIGSTGRLAAGNYSQNISNNGSFIFGSNSNQTLSGIITGSGSLTKNGSGTLTLSNGNSYTGGTTVNNGTIILGATNAIQGTSLIINSGASVVNGGVHGPTGSGVNLTINGGTFDIGLYTSRMSTVTMTDGSLLGAGYNNNYFIENGFTLAGNNTITGGVDIRTVAAGTFNVTSGTTTISGQIANVHGSLNPLTKNGTGTLTLSGSNTYNGTIVNAGAFNVTSTGSLRSGGNLTVAANATANLANANQNLGVVSNANTATNALNFSAATGTITIASLSGNGSTRFGSNGTVTGGISSGTVTSVGALTANITGGSINAGGLLTGTISNGTVNAGSLNSSSITGGTNTITGVATITTLNGGSTTVGGNATIGTLTSGTANLNGASSSITTLNGGTTTVAGIANITTMSSGTANLNGATSAITTLNGGTVNLGDGDALAVSGGNSSGSITGNGSLTKIGVGTLTLSGNNSYTGATLISGGTLKLTGAGSIGGTSEVSLGTVGTLDVSETTSTSTVGVLKGSGTVTGNLTVTDELSIGNSPGTTTFNGDLTLGAGATYTYEFTSAETAADLGIVTGNLNITGAILDLQQLGMYVINEKFTLFAYQGTWTGTFFGALDVDGSSFTYGELVDGAKVWDGFGGIWEINYNDTTAGLNGGTAGYNYVTITAVPEPNVIALLGGLGLLALLRRRR